MTREAKNSGETAKRRPRGRGRPFPKGKSGNPKGRPKTRWELVEKIQRRGDDLVDALFEIMDDLPKRFAVEDGEGYTLVGPTHRERIEAIKVLKAYGYGKPIVQVEVSTPEGKSITIRTIDKMTSPQKRKRLNELLAKARKGPSGGGGPV